MSTTTNMSASLLSSYFQLPRVTRALRNLKKKISIFFSILSKYVGNNYGMSKPRVFWRLMNTIRSGNSYFREIMLKLFSWQTRIDLTWIWKNVYIFFVLNPTESFERFRRFVCIDFSANGTRYTITKAYWLVWPCGAIREPESRVCGPQTIDYTHRNKTHRLTFFRCCSLALWLLPRENARVSASACLLRLLIQAP